MSAGLEPDLSNTEEFIRRFPIHRACRDGDVGALLSLLQQLSNRAALTAEDSCYGWTPIHWAAHYGQLECMARLVQTGCEVNATTSRFNQTPAHTAAFGGHPHCVVWLTQAGADVNRQDLVGEAPIHKAARSGSLECIQVLLIAGAKPHLRNASGQTAADLAHAHGFHDCSRLVSKNQKHLLLHVAGVHANRAQSGNGAPCGQELLGRKRLLTAMDAGHMKKARRTEHVLVQMQTSGEELESMSMELHSGQPEAAVAAANGRRHALPHVAPEQPRSLPSPPSPPANQQAAMCGSLHLAGSPSSCVSHRPAWRGLTGADCADFLRYGHYHGFGDTAEELSDDGGGGGGVQAERKCKQAVASSVHLYHGS